MKRTLKTIFSSGLIVIFFLIAIVFYQFFLFGHIPMPADTIVGAYFPWLDQKWGYAVGVPVKNALISDVFSQFFLWKYYSVDLLKQGIWPLWNIYSLSGTPFLATYHSAVFLPFNLLLLLPKYYGWGFYIFAQHLIAALGMYLFLGLYIKNKSAQIVGGLIFAFSGLMTTWSEFGTGAYAASMLPWIFYAVEKYLTDSKGRYLILLTISFVLLFLAGHAQLTTYSVILFGVYLIYIFFKKRYKSYGQLLNIIIFSALSGGIVALQLLPALDLTKVSIRGDEIFWENVNHGISPIYELVRLFAADFFGNPTTYNHYDSQSYHEQSSFLGTLALVFILPFIFKRFRNKEISFWAVTFLVSLILAFENPLTNFLYSLSLPLLTYSAASRIFFLTSFSGAFLVGIGIDLFLKDKKHAFFVNRATWGLLAVIVGIIIGYLICIYMLTPYVDFDNYSWIIKNIKVTLKNLVVPIGLLGIFLIICLEKPYIKLVFFKKILPIIIVALFFADLARFYLKYNPFITQDFVYPQTKITDYLKSQEGLFRIARADKELLPPNTWMFFNLQSAEGYDPLALENYGRYFNRVNNAPYDGGVIRYIELSTYPSKFLDSLNVKYLLAIKRARDGTIPGEFLNYVIEERTDFKKIYEDKSVAILENPHGQERAYFVEKVTKLISRDQLIALLNQESFDPTKEGLIVTLDNLPEVKKGNSVNITSYTPNEITLETESAGDSFVVLADTYEKGWKLLKDGEQVKLYEVNGALRGFVAPEGKHNFKMYYFPDSFKYGLYISSFSLLAFILLIIYLYKRKNI